MIWGDDIGITNISAYSRGMMGYETPNIDRIANEGALFTDYYAEQSCTAGRAGFITGQIPFRTGLTKVGLPGAKLGLSHEDPTIAELLKNHGYATGQFGKNHVGDRNEYLPTVHGFDEYSGVLYHLNALEEPENVDYPKNPEFLAKFGPRNVITYTLGHRQSRQNGRPALGRGRQAEDQGRRCADQEAHGDLRRGDTSVFAEVYRQSCQRRQAFFVWHNATRMHVFTHLSKKYMDMVPEKGFYGAGMTEFDDDIGVLLKQLDDLGIADNTIVIISTDNGAEVFTWPDGGTTPFRGEKATTWEGGFRVPAVVRWPGVIKPGTVINDIFSHLDWMPTFMAAVGEPDIKEKLLKGHKADGKKFKVHLDGYDQTALLKGEGPRVRARRSSTSPTTAICQRSGITSGRCSSPSRRSTGMDVWREPLSPTRMPILVDLHADPFEAAVSRGHSYEYDKVGRRADVCVSSPLRPSWRSSYGNLQGVSAKAESRPASASVTPSRSCRQLRRVNSG